MSVVARVTLADLADEAGAVLPGGADPALPFHATAPLQLAGARDVAVYVEADLAALAATRAGACFVTARDLEHVPAHTIALVVDDPWAAFLRCAARFGPRLGTAAAAARPSGIDPQAIVHPEARLEAHVAIEAGVVVGLDVEIGTGTGIGAHSVIGAGVRIGRGCAIDAHVTIRNALIGDRVVIQAGTRLGVSHADDKGGRVPLGRVIIQDDVEIGAGTIVERGAVGDTTIGERARLDARTIVRADATIDRCAREGAFSCGAKMV